MGAVIEVRDLAFSYGATQALKGVTLTVGEGQLTVILGPNGAGKSTLFELVAGTLTPQAGLVRVLGADPARPTDAWLARIGVLPQGVRDRGKWSIRMLLDWVGAHYRAAGRDVRGAAEVAALVGLEDRLDDTLLALSGGQRRRADLAAALIARPDLLLLDEPTAGLDPVIKAEIHDVLLAEIDRGATILLATHDMGEAQRIASDIAVLADGEVVFGGTPQQLRDRVGAEAQVTWVSEGVRHVHATTDPEAFMATLDLACVRHLEITRPDLEDAYIDLLTQPGDRHD